MFLAPGTKYFLLTECLPVSAALGARTAGYEPALYRLAEDKRPLRTLEVEQEFEDSSFNMDRNIEEDSCVEGRLAASIEVP